MRKQEFISQFRSCIKEVYKVAGDAALSEILSGRIDLETAGMDQVKAAVTRFLKSEAGQFAPRKGNT